MPRNDNNNKGYVDKGDRLKSYYELIQKSRKFLPSFFFYVLDVVVVNSLVLFNIRLLQLEELELVGLNLKDFCLAVDAGLVVLSLRCEESSWLNLSVNSKQVFRQENELTKLCICQYAIHLGNLLIVVQEVILAEQNGPIKLVQSWLVSLGTEKLFCKLFRKLIAFY